MPTERLRLLRLFPNNPVMRVRVRAREYPDKGEKAQKAQDPFPNPRSEP